MAMPVAAEIKPPSSRGRRRLALGLGQHEHEQKRDQDRPGVDHDRGHGQELAPAKKNRPAVPSSDRPNQMAQ